MTKPAKVDRRRVPPESRRVLVAMRLPPSAVEQMRAIAHELGVSQSDAVAAALELYRRG